MLKYIAVFIIAAITGLFAGRMSVTSSAPVADADTSQPNNSVTNSITFSDTHSSDNSASQEEFQNITVFSSLFDQSNISDFDKLARAAADSKNDVDSTAFLEVLVTEWSKKDPLGALTFAKSQDNPGLMFLALRNMGKQDSDTALDWIQNNVKDLTLHGHLMTAVFQGLSKKDPAKAVTLATELANGSAKEQILSVTLDEWAKQDIDAVFSWIETAEFSQHTPQYYDQVMNRYITDSPEKAAELVAKMEDSDSKSNFASNVAYGLANESISEATEWVKTLSGQDKQFALEGLLENWAGKEDGIGALDYVRQHSDEPSYDNLFEKTAMKLSQSNPTALESQLPNLNESEQALAAGQLSQIYSANAPEKALSLINKLDAGKVQDAAINGALNSFRYNDISSAFELTEIYSNTETRISQMQEVMLDWVKVDPQSAEAALSKTTTIPQDQKDTMLKWIYHKVKPRNEFLLPE